MTYPSPEVLVCCGRRDHARHQRRIVPVVAWMPGPKHGTAPGGADRSGGPHHLACRREVRHLHVRDLHRLDHVCHLVAYGLFVWITAVQVANARPLAGLRVRVDASGIALNGPGSKAPWSHPCDGRP